MSSKEAIEPLLHFYSNKDSELDAERLTLVGCVDECHANVEELSHRLDAEIDAAKEINSDVQVGVYMSGALERPICSHGDRWTKKGLLNFGIYETGAVHFHISCETLWKFRTNKTDSSFNDQSKKMLQKSNELAVRYRFTEARTHNLQIWNSLQFCYSRLIHCLGEEHPNALDDYAIYDENRQFFGIYPRTDSSTPYSRKQSQVLKKHYPNSKRYCSYAQHLARTYPTDEELHYIGVVSDLALGTFHKIAAGSSFQNGQSRDARLFKLGKLMERWRYKLHRERKVLKGKKFDRTDKPRTSEATNARKLDKHRRLGKIRTAIGRVELNDFRMGSGKVNAAKLAREILRLGTFNTEPNPPTVTTVANLIRECPDWV